MVFTRSLKGIGMMGTSTSITPTDFSMEQVSESRLGDLKKEITQLEEELEQTRWDCCNVPCPRINRGRCVFP